MLENLGVRGHHQSCSHTQRLQIPRGARFWQGEANFFQVYKSTYAHISSTAVSIQQIKEVRKGLTRGTYPKDHCFSIIYTEGKKSRTLELMAHNSADADAWMQGLNFLVNKKCRSHDQQGQEQEFRLPCLEPNQVGNSVSRALFFGIACLGFEAAQLTCGCFMIACIYYS